MAEQATVMQAVGDTSPVLSLAGPYFIWRGPGDGTLALEIRRKGSTTWRTTGDTMTAAGVAKDTAPYSGNVEYRLRCTALAAGASIAFEVIQ